MSLADALRFFGEARRDRVVRGELEALAAETNWETLTQLAIRAGYEVTTDELLYAHTLDWRLRWMRYQDSSERKSEPA
jgi:hypothetical protein